MTTTTLPTKFIRQRQFFLFLPLILLPFASFFFWAFGGGNQQVSAQNHLSKSLLHTLPQVDLSSHEGFDKMNYYEKAEQDSLKLKQLQKNDPHYITREGFVTPSHIDRFNTPLQQEEMLYKKLEQLNTVLNTSPPAYPSSKPIDPLHEEQKLKVSQLERMMTEMEQPDESDPELIQLNGMLEKILAIQNPEKAAPQKETLHTEQIFSALPAVIEKNQKVSHGSVIKLRLIEQTVLNGHTIPKDHLIYGIGEITNQRIKLRIKNIRLGHSLLPVDLTVFDMRDGMEGINVPEALINEAIRESSGSAIQSMQLLPFEQSLETQIAGAGITAAKGLFNKKVKRIKVKLSDSYPLLLKDNQKKQY
jgi:hypothetical protein